MKALQPFVISLFSAVLFIAGARTCPAQNERDGIVENATLSSIPAMVTEDRPHMALLIDSLPTPTGFDSLKYTRKILMGTVSRKGTVLEQKALKELFRENTAAGHKYRLGRYMKPLGVLVSVGGIGLSYIALKGKPASVVVEGIKYDYTIRSLPKLIAGIGGFFGGICLIEFGHELQGASVNIYNSSLQKDRTSLLRSVRFGITPSGNMGLFARF